MNIALVTCADKAPKESYYLFDEMKESLRRLGLEPIILGWGEPWGGLGSKPRLLKQAIESGKITAERIIWFDAFDVVFVDPPEIMVELAIEFFDDKLVYNAEKNCFPDASLAEKHPQTKHPFRYLNSGFAVGRTCDFMAMLEWIKADEIPNDSRNPDGSGNHPNDQDYVMRAFVSGELPMALDTSGIICHTLCGVEESEFDFSGESIENLKTGAWPCAFHANGPSKDSGIMAPILRKLGYR